MSDITARDGTRIHYETTGDGSPVLLLHGMGGSYRTGWVERGWSDLLVANGFRVIGVDARGCGESSSIDEPKSLQDRVFLSDIISVLDAAGATSVHAIGYSMGAGHALRLGLSHPERVRSLTLGGLGGIALAMAGFYHRSEANTRRFLQNGQVALERQASARPGLSARYVTAYFEALQQDALSEGDLELLTNPTLFCVGEGDTLQGDFAALTVTDVLSQRIPGARRIVFPGYDHGTLVAAPEFKATVLDFLSEQSVAHRPG